MAAHYTMVLPRRQFRAVKFRGGGGGYQAFGGAGGSGIVVLRFARAKKGTAVIVF